MISLESKFCSFLKKVIFTDYEWHSCDPNCVKNATGTFSCKKCKKTFRRFGIYEGHPCRKEEKENEDGFSKKRVKNIGKSNN